MNSINEKELNVNQLKKTFIEEKESIKKSFFSNYSGIKNNRHNSDLIDKIIKKIFFIQKGKNKRNFEKFCIYPELC